MSYSEGTRYIQRAEPGEPVWKKFIVESALPARLAPLRELSRNLWWVWITKARELFQYTDPEIWEECSNNPVVLLEEVSFKRLKKLENDEVFIRKMEEVYGQFKNYLAEREQLYRPQIAYFSMEYGLHDSLKIFSGGLGILAGDYLKQASDSKVNLVGVGLLYRYGYFKQTLSLSGEQIANYISEHFSKIPVQPSMDKDGNWIEVEVEFPGRTLYARVWEVHVGSVRLYLLDADFPANQDYDRVVTHHLYGGDSENRIKQEILLGIGGIRALRKLGIEADIYHCNEGHAAFIGLERINEYVARNSLNFTEAREVVRSSTIFTTHTPVPAGHDSFHDDLFRAYMGEYAGKLGLSMDEFLMQGKAYPHENYFNMSYLACQLSQGINGVSRLHGEVSKKILMELYPGYLEKEVEIGYVTNGVHFCTWTAQEWKDIFKKYFGEEFPENILDFNVWENIYKVPDEEIWKLKNTLRHKLIDSIKTRFSNNWIKRNEDPRIISEIKSRLDPNSLTIGFARRFATYKRAYLLFRNLERLSAIVNDPDRPVQFIFAGKAHPADKAGQDLIKRIVEISKSQEFRGKIVFLQNYDMELAKTMLQGVDVWLNTPTRPLEASGTSGEKGVMNGTLHFSVLDGWWVEGYKKDAGWALQQERSFEIQDFQDELDAETIYSILEKEIIEAYYERNDTGVPEKWIGFIKNTIARVAPHFTTARMINDYQERFYSPQYNRAKAMNENDFRLAREISAWKFRVSSIWDAIEVKEIQILDGITNTMKIGQGYPVVVKVDLKGLSCHEVGLELVITQNGVDRPQDFVERIEFGVDGCLDGICCYKLDLHIDKAGSYNYALRLFPKNESLAHRQDFNYVKWI